MQSPGRRVEHRPRAVLFIQMTIFASFVAVNTCLTGSPLCPRSLDCARAGRYFCQAGSSHCGPCLKPLVENSHGKCVVKRRPVSHYGKLKSQPELDEEIDFLSTIISQHRTETVVRPPAHPAPVLKFEEEEPKSPAPTQEPTTQSHSLLTVALPTRTNHTTNPIPTLHSKPVILPYPSNDHVFVVMCSVFIVTGSLALILAGVCWVRLQRGCRLAQKLDYTAYGGKGPHSYDNNVPGDKKLARSAQMYHYQHQKQQMLSLEKHRDEPKVSDSGATSDEENEDGDFTVYECPGLAPTGEMEVKNPLFDDSTLYLQRFHK